MLVARLAGNRVPDPAQARCWPMLAQVLFRASGWAVSSSAIYVYVWTWGLLIVRRSISGSRLAAQRFHSFPE